MSILPHVFRTRMEVLHVAKELLHGLLIHLPALLDRAELRFAEHAGIGVAAGPLNHSRRTRREQIDPIEGAVVFVEADHPVLHQILAHVVFVEIQI